jgi:hypothetical protein
MNGALLETSVLFTAVIDAKAAHVQDLAVLSVAARALFAQINNCSDPTQLDAVVRMIWDAVGKGYVSEGEAVLLCDCVQSRRPHTTSWSAQPLASGTARLASRLSSRFAPRKPQRSPDRQSSRFRRRMLGGSGALPDKLRQHYTEGERAVLCIVAGEVKRHGICDLPIDKIAALAGVCRTTCQNAMHEARRLNHLKITERPQPGRKNLPNIVEIVAPEWIAWIKRGPSAARTIGSKSVKIVSTTKNTDLRKEEAQQDLQCGNGPEPPPDRRCWVAA